MTAPVKIMLVAAEASGDALGAGLAAALKLQDPEVTFVGIGGPRMAEQGIISPFDIAELSILGSLMLCDFKLEVLRLQIQSFENAIRHAQNYYFYVLVASPL